MGLGLRSSVERAFYRNGPREVHTVIDEGILKKGEIWPEGGRLIDGLNWRSQEDGSPLVLAYL